MLKTPIPTLLLTLHKDPEALAHRAASFILDAIRHNPRLLLAAATGSTPTRTYNLLAESAAADPSRFNQLRILKLDEWGGLALDDPATCETYLRHHLIDPLRIPRDRFLSFNSNPADPDAEAKRIRGMLHQHGPIDLCILGLGANGHLAFNEPADTLTPHAHVARLSPSSLEHPMLRESRSTPTFGLTLGLADILQSRQILLLVSGRHKRDQLQRLLTPQIDTRFPASFLHLHPSVTIIADHDAASSPAQP